MSEHEAQSPLSLDTIPISSRPQSTEQWKDVGWPRLPAAYYVE